MKTFRVKAKVSLDFFVRAESEVKAIARVSNKHEYVFYNLIPAKYTDPPQKLDTAEIIFDSSIDEVEVEEIQRP